MKLFKNVAFSVALLLTTSLLISAFMIFFNFSYSASKVESKENLLNSISVVSGSSDELKSPTTISK